MATETYTLRIQGLEFASYRETVLHFSGVGVNSNDTLAAGESLIAAFIASAESLWLATLPQTYYLMQYEARRTTPKPSAVAHTEYNPFSKYGSRGANGVCQQTCPVLFLVPTMGTKSGGKIFWPTISLGDIVNSSPISAWRTAVTAWLNAVKAGITNAGITWTLAIWSRKTQSTANVSIGQFSPLIGFQSNRRKPTGAV